MPAASCGGRARDAPRNNYAPLPGRAMHVPRPSHSTSSKGPEPSVIDKLVRMPIRVAWARSPAAMQKAACVSSLTLPRSPTSTHSPNAAAWAAAGVPLKPPGAVPHVSVSDQVRVLRERGRERRRERRGSAAGATRDGERAGGEARHNAPAASLNLLLPSLSPLAQPAPQGEFVRGVEGEFEVVEADGIVFKRRRTLAPGGAAAAAAAAAAAGRPRATSLAHGAGSDPSVGRAPGAAAGASVPASAPPGSRPRPRVSTAARAEAAGRRGEAAAAGDAAEAARLRALWSQLVEAEAARVAQAGAASAIGGAGSVRTSTASAVASALRATVPAVAAALADGTLVCGSAAAGALAAAAAAAREPTDSAAALAAAKARAAARLDALATEEGEWASLLERARGAGPPPLPPMASGGGEACRAEEDGPDSSRPGVLRRAARAARRRLAVRVEALAALVAGAEALAGRAERAAVAAHAAWHAVRAARTAATVGGVVDVDSPGALMAGLLGGR